MCCKELRLINWKSFKDAVLYIDSLTVIIGLNASGKSNLLDALLFLQRISHLTSISTAISGDSELPGLRGGLEWIVRNPGEEFTLEVLVSSGDDERTDYLYSITVAIEGSAARLAAESLVSLRYRPGSDKPIKRNLFVAEAEDSTMPLSLIPVYFYMPNKERKKRFNLNRIRPILVQVDSLDVFKEISASAKHVIEQLQRIFILDPIPNHMRKYQPLATKLQTDAANIAGVLAANKLNSALNANVNTQDIENIEEVLTGYFTKLPEGDIGRVWTELVGKFKTDAMLYCEEQWATDAEPVIVDLRGMSGGTLRFMAIVSALLTLEEGSLLVIEEVDNGLHPSRAKVLVNMLRELGRKRNIDVIVTTHNQAVLDTLGSRMVPFITVVHRDRKTGASTLTLLEDIKLFPKLLASGSIGQLSAQGKIESALNFEDEKIVK